LCNAISSRSPLLTCLIIVICAAEPIRLTDSPILIAGRVPLLKSFGSKNNCPSVIEIMFVGIYAESSLPWVSTTGIPVHEPLPSSSPTFAQRSRRRACKKKISPGNASLAGGRLRSSEICLYEFACRERSFIKITASKPEYIKYSPKQAPTKGANH